MQHPTTFDERFHHILEALREQEVQYALVGGLAVTHYTTPRFTKDVDFALALAGTEQSRLLRNLRTDGYREGQTLESLVRDELIGVRLFAPGSDSQEPNVDLLFAACGAEKEIVEGARVATVLDQSVHVAQLGDLVAMKVLSENENRHLDRADIDGLLGVADKADIVRARNTIGLISERGYARGKDLGAALEAYLRRLRAQT